MPQLDLAFSERKRFGFLCRQGLVINPKLRAEALRSGWPLGFTPARPVVIPMVRAPPADLCSLNNPSPFPRAKRFVLERHWAGVKNPLAENEALPFWA